MILQVDNWFIIEYYVILRNTRMTPGSSKRHKD